MKHQIFLILAIAFGFIEASPASGTIFAINMQGQFGSYNPQNADFTQIGQQITTELQSQELSTIDNTNEIFYIVGENTTLSKNTLVGIDLNTGKVISSTVLPFELGTFVGVGQTCAVDPTNGDVLISGRDNSVGGKHRFYRVTPSTGKMTPFATVAYADILSAGSAYDYKNQILWTEYDLNKTAFGIFAIDVNTGNVKYVLNDYPYLETMNYDPVTELVYGIGLITKPVTNRVLLSLDSTTGKMEILGIIPGYFVIDSDVAALDYEQGFVYTFLQPAGNETAPFNFLTINRQNGIILHETYGCSSELLECPWSIEVYNTPLNKK